MPTVVIYCKPEWYPSEEETPMLDGGGSTTTMSMAMWLCRAVTDAVNAHTANQIEIDDVVIRYERLHPASTCFVDLYVIVNPPEVSGSFYQRMLRRGRICRAIGDDMRSQLLYHSDHLLLPTWTFEVIPVESSGMSMNPGLDTTYTWGLPVEIN